MAKITIIIEDFEFPAPRLVDTGKPEPDAEPDAKPDAKPVLYTEKNPPEWGETVLVRDAACDPWISGIFCRFIRESAFPWRTSDTGWRMCAKYDEQVLGTTNS